VQDLFMTTRCINSRSLSLSLVYHTDQSVYLCVVRSFRRPITRVRSVSRHSPALNASLSTRAGTCSVVSVCVRIAS